MDARAAGALIVYRVLSQGRSLTAIAQEILPTLVDPREKALAQELAYGTIRWLPRLQTILAQLLQRPLRQKDSDIQALLLIGLYQLVYLRIPHHAAVSASVNASSVFRKPWSKSLINGVLRNYLRNSEALMDAADQSQPARFGHPEWLFTEIRRAWPDDWEEIITANNRQAPMTLRINPGRTTRDDYLKTLKGADLEGFPLAFAPQGIILSNPTDVSNLPGFSDGLVSVQDAAAQLAAPLLEIKPGERILDACAAPGGKTAHILELQPKPERLTALEISSARVNILKSTLARLNLEAEILTGDARRPEEWWDGQQYDKILLDAPCSATGVIRRHPDIKVHRRAQDIAPLVQQQRDLLNGLWPLLVTGGKILYATCSILPQENDLQINSFLADRKEARLQAIMQSWGRSLKSGRQILTGEEDMDGFFYACMVKS